MNRVADWQADWPASLKEAGLLLLCAVVAAGGWWARQEDPLPLAADPEVYQLELAAPLVDVATSLRYFDEGVHLFVDTRAEPGGETIPGALRIREATFDDDLLANFDFLFPEDALVLFGNGELTRTSNVAGRLIERGYVNIEILSGGLSAWKKADGETSPVIPEDTP